MPKSGSLPVMASPVVSGKVVRLTAALDEESLTFQELNGFLVKALEKLSDLHHHELLSRQLEVESLKSGSSVVNSDFEREPPKPPEILTFDDAPRPPSELPPRPSCLPGECPEPEEPELPGPMRDISCRIRFREDLSEPPPVAESPLRRIGRRIVAATAIGRRIGAGLGLRDSSSSPAVPALESELKKQKRETRMEQPSRDSVRPQTRESVEKKRKKFKSWMGMRRILRHTTMNRADTVSGSSSLGLNLFWDYPGQTRQFLEKPITEVVAMFLIFLHCVTLVIAANMALVGSPREWKKALLVIDCFLSGLSFTEVLLRWRVYGAGAFKPTTPDRIFNFIDLVVTAIPGVLFGWILTPAGVSFLELTPAGQAMQIMMLSRFCRLARSYRIANKMDRLQDLRVILRGLAGSFKTLVSALLMLTVTLFAFATLGVVVIGKPVQDLARLNLDPDEAATLQDLTDNFVGTLPRMAYTLFKLLTGQITATTFIPMVDKRVGGVWVFFVSFSAVMDLLMMNLITAIIVESSIGRSQNEERERQEVESNKRATKQLEELTDLFGMMDDNGDGTLAWSEFKAGMRNTEIKARWKGLNITPDEAKSCFVMLDREGRGEVPIDDFFEGLKRMQGQAQAQDLFYVGLLLQDLLMEFRESRGRPSVTMNQN